MSRIVRSGYRPAASCPFARSQAASECWLGGVRWHSSRPCGAVPWPSCAQSEHSLGLGSIQLSADRAEVGGPDVTAAPESRVAGQQLAAHQRSASARVVPVQVASMPDSAAAQEPECQRRLVDLSRSAEKHHLALQIVANRVLKVPRHRSGIARHDLNSNGESLVSLKSARL